MNNYTQMIKQAQRQYKIKMKIEKEESIANMEKETKFRENLVLAQIREERAEQLKREEELTKDIESINSFLYVWASRLIYREWLTLRDIVTKDFIQVESDINRGKITLEQISKLKSIALLRV